MTKKDFLGGIPSEKYVFFGRGGESHVFFRGVRFTCLISISGIAHLESTLYLQSMYLKKKKLNQIKLKTKTKNTSLIHMKSNQIK